MTSERLTRPIAFVVEADKLKTIVRRTPLTDNSRHENSAEHSWHLAVAAMALYEYAPKGTNLLRVLELVTVHDLVEIDAGDTFAYDAQAGIGKVDREPVAAERLFGLLPSEEADEPCGRNSRPPNRPKLDSPTHSTGFRLREHESGWGSWFAHAVTRSQVLKRMEPIRTAMPGVWPQAGGDQNACDGGYIRIGQSRVASRESRVMSRESRVASPQQPAASSGSD
jgi:putative hydrolase of HD superfamily